MADFHCPLCQKAMIRRARKDNSGYFWSCTGYPDCKFSSDDFRDEPFLAKCGECGNFLKKGVSKSNGKPYTACFNEDAHSSGKPIFYNDDGSPRGEPKAKPKVKGKFTCPECGGELEAFFMKNGPRAGEVSWMCKNKDAHGGQNKFFEDNQGRPLI